MPEAGFGAVAEDGSIYIMQDAALWISNGVIERIVQEQREEIERRIKMLRMDEPLPNVESKTVILVDDGIAMGSTMRVAIMLCKKRNAKKIVVAVPVAGESVAREIEAMVDEAIVLEKPWNFRAVAQVYQNWYDVSDEEAIKILHSAKG
jgi:predicted phosphoribosyltransferase